MTEYYYTSRLTMASAAIDQGFEGCISLYDYMWHHNEPFPVWDKKG
jgi:hypothetical protein